MYDQIEKMGDSVIQHGKYNDRVYLMKLSKNDLTEIIDKIEALAGKNRYSKIFAKIPAWGIDEFKRKGYCSKATIPGFYRGDTDVYFVSKFLEPSREKVDNQIKEKINTIKELSLAKKNQSFQVNPGFEYRKIEEKDITQLTELYKIVFPTYPFPIFDPDYIRETMKDHIDYFGAFDKDKLAAASSAEMDKEALNAEMTDFATFPNYLGNGLAVALLQQMEIAMRKCGIVTAYTIARSVSAGMNITFAKLSYEFSGTLINNTNISGNIESMNIWYKKL